MNYMKRLMALAMAVSLFVTSFIDVNAVASQQQNTEQSQREQLQKKADRDNENVIDKNDEKKQNSRIAKEAGIDLHGEKAAAEVQGDAKTKNEAMPNGAEPTGKATITKGNNKDVSANLNKNDKAESKKELEKIDPKQKVRVMIIMDGASIIDDDTEAQPNFMSKVRSAMMTSMQDVVASRIEKKVLKGKDLNVRYHYTWLTNAVAAEVEYGKINEIENVNGVSKVLTVPEYTIDPLTVNDGEMIGREDTWNAGYTGTGTKIAVIDTGLDYTHPSFADDPEMIDTNTTESDVADKLASLHATQLYKNTVNKDLISEDVWYSNKIPYGFNYVDENLVIDHNHDQVSDHGTHVAGIAAANDLGKDKAVGVAPDAQLYIMKVFGFNGGAYGDDLLAAVEDSLVLDADVINMSLGYPAGFASDSDEFSEIYNRVSETDTVLATAAGNATSSAQANLWGTNKSLTGNPDNGIVSSPATYASTTTVASVDNKAVFGNFIQVGDHKINYDQGTNNTGYSMLGLVGQTLDYVMVDNYGQTLEDFTSVDVTNKVAVVQRGISNFADKRKLAQEAGAVACFIYNNTSGTLGMDMTGEGTIPVGAITMQAGEYMAEASKAGNAKLFVAVEEAAFPSETAYRMSSFSSWGVSPNLELRPDITAPGGNIYSTRNNGKYGVMSGTSMASPNIAGCAALVKEYVRETYPDLEDSEVHKLVNTLMMSTADPLNYDDDLKYSPRNQGAGLVNTYNAVRTPAYLSIKGSRLPKVSLMDDPNKTGQYTYEFQVTNQSDKELRYAMKTNVQSEGVEKDDASGEDFMSMTPVGLDANITMKSTSNQSYIYDFNNDGNVNTADARWLYCEIKDGRSFTADDAFYYDVNKDEKVDTDDVQKLLDVFVGKDSLDLTKQILRVAPKETKTVSVTINLKDSAKKYMDANFKNGIYVEGFSTLTALNEGGVDLSLPYMGFYGDWTQAPMIDSGFYWEDEEESKASQYPNVLLTDFGNDKDVAPLGMNMYFDEEFDINKISVSPNGDGYYDEIAEIDLSLLRNAKSLSFTFEDAKTHKILYQDNVNYARKTKLDDSYGMIVPFVYPAMAGKEKSFDFKDKDGNYLKNNTKLNLIIKGELDYDKHTAKNEFDTWNVPITVDTEGPQVTTDDAQIYVDPDTKKQYITVSFKDGVGVSSMNFMNVKGTTILAKYPVDRTEAGKEVKMTFDITGFGSDFLMAPQDYAGNATIYEVHTEDNDPIVDKNLLYGYRVSDSQIQSDELYGWIAMNKEDKNEAKVMSSEPYIDYALNSAEYIDKYIVAVDANNDLVWIQPGYWDNRKHIAHLGITVNELAFDPVTKQLFAYDRTNYRLVTIDIMDGTITPVGNYLTSLVAMTCGNDGTLYGITNQGDLKTIDKNSGEWGETLFKTDKYATYTQSMTFDAETESIYWAYYSNSDDAGTLYRIDTKNNFEMSDMGVIAGHAEVVGLLCMNDRGFQLPDKEAQSIKLTMETMTMLQGQKQSLNVSVDPWNAVIDDIVWSSENENIASVDKFGNVITKGIGNTKIVAETKDGKFKATCDVHVVKPNSDLKGFVMSGEKLYNQWISFNAGQADQVKEDTEPVSLSFSAGDYVNGSIYTYSTAAAFYRVDAKTLKAEKLSDNRDGIIVADMAFDYSTGYMYAIIQDDSGINLTRVDLLSGDYEVVGSAIDMHGSPACGLAISTDGVIYIVTQNGMLNTYDTTTKSMKKVGFTGYTGSQLLQSLAFDHNTKELYWSMLSMDGLAMLMYIDPTNAQALPLGPIEQGSQVTAMYVVPNEIPEIPYVPVESVKLKKDSLTTIAGSRTSLAIDIKPYNATNKNMTWTLDDPSLAKIENNILLAKKAGKTKATGKLSDKNGTFKVEIEINIVPSAGAIRGYVLNDLSTNSGQFWSEIKDYDLSKGEGLVNVSDSYVYAGEYYDGKLYTYGTNAETFDSQFMVFDESTFKYTKVIKGDFNNIDDMAFDYSQSAMYGIGAPINSKGKSTLYAIDIETGDTFPIAKLDATLRAMACSTDGHLYGVSTEGILYEIDKINGSLREIGNTGVEASQYQSMAFDHNTGNMYWAQMFFDPMMEKFKSGLKLVNTETAEITNLGLIGEAGAQYASMYIKPNDTIKPIDPEVTGVSIDQSKAMMKKDEQLQLQSITLPISVNGKKPVTYSSSDPTIATVSKDGLVTAKAYGKAVITAMSENGHSATCMVNVLNPDKQFYAFNTDGWQTSAILETDKVNNTELSETAGFQINAAIFKNDYFYALDTKGVLWKFNEDQTDIQKIADVKGKIAYDQDKYNEAEITDMTVNSFNQKAYILVCLKTDWSKNFAVYELDVTTGALTEKFIDEEGILYRAGSFSFVNEQKAFVYDMYNNTINSIDLESGKVEQVSWVQNIINTGDNNGMVYSKELDMLFYAAAGFNTNKVTLYTIDPESGVAKVLSNTKYDSDLQSIVLKE